MKENNNAQSDILKLIQKPMTAENVVEKLHFFTDWIVANKGMLEPKFLVLIRRYLDFTLNVIQTQYSRASNLREIVTAYTQSSILCDMELDALLDIVV
jgi:hypothetical protein